MEGILLEINYFLIEEYGMNYRIDGGFLFFFFYYMNIVDIWGLGLKGNIRFWRRFFLSFFFFESDFV